MIKQLTRVLIACFVIIMPARGVAQVVANFSSSTTSGCSPIVVQFNDISTGNPTSWNWNLGNGTLSSLQNPSTTYIIPGTYTVTLTVSDGTTNNTKTVTNYITVIPTPIVQFKANDSSISCPPKTIQFTDLSVLGVAGAGTYFWDFGDGSTSNQQNPIHTYTNIGNYNVLLSVTNSSNCTKILMKPQYIKLIANPVANFTAANNNACTPPITANFTNTSTNAFSYQWFFGDGGTSNSVNPVHVYNAPGSYTVTLIATNTAGCIDTIILPASVNIGNLNASFTKSASTVCKNVPVTFTNTSTPGVGISNWNYGDGNTGTGTVSSHGYAAPGTYTVTLIVDYNNCSDTTTQSVTVLGGPTAAFTATVTSACTTPLTTHFNNNTTGGPTGYLWMFGDGGTATGTSPNHTYTAIGSYTVTLVAYGSNGCNDTLVMPNYINITQPNGNIIATPALGCVPATVSFSNNITGIISSYSWNFGDGSPLSTAASPSHVYGVVGTYTVTLNFTTTLGCSGTKTTTVTVGPTPNANFYATPTNVCPIDSVGFFNTSTGPPGTTWLWIFGDGSTSTDSNALHNYNNPGIYTVMLVATNNGCSDTLIIPNYITVNYPKAQFLPVYSCTNKLTVTFTDQSDSADTWFYDFGDGTTSTLQSPVHTFPAYGTYTVIQIVTNFITGCSAIRSKNINLFDPQAQFVANDTTICKGESVTFSAVLTPNVNQYIWDFGDGGTFSSNLTTAVHQYNTAGTYTVRLVIKDAHNCYDTLIRTNYIKVGAPLVNFVAVPTSGCAPLTVTFTDLTNTFGFGFTSKTWDFGDGTFSTSLANVFTHTYANPGSYTVALSILDANGCEDHHTKYNYILVSRPDANFAAVDTSVCIGETVTFIDSSHASIGTTLTYAWNFGDGGTSTLAAPTHVYNTQGFYTVRLVVTDSVGCKDTLIRTDYIHVYGVDLSFTMSDSFATCPPLTVNFANTSTGLSFFAWNFDNGNISYLINPVTIYSSPDTYTVVLVGQNVLGCWDSISKDIIVLGPTGTFAYAPLNGCVPITVVFTSQNTGATQLTWDMDNGVTATTTASTFTYTYTTAGNYIPKLILSDGNFCTIAIIGPDTIKADQLDVDFSYSPNNICQAGTMQFVDTTIYSNNPVVFRSWDFGDGGTSSIHNPTHFYTAPGSYVVKLIMGTQACNDTVIKVVNILPDPVISAGNNQGTCAGGSVQLQAIGAANYTWSPSTGLSCTSCPNPVATPGGTTTYTVIGTAANGCKDTTTVQVSINPLPNVSAGPNVSVCAGGSVTLQATGAVNFSWAPATGLSCTGCPNPTASPASTTTYILTGINGTNCTDTAQVTVTVNALPTVSVSNPDTICAGFTTQLQASGANSYSWSPGTGLSCINCASPTAAPTVTTTYIVTGTAVNTCTDTAQVTITVDPAPIISPGNNQAICIGDSAQLLVTGATTYAWTPATGLSCTNCPNPVANPTTTTTYTIIAGAANGCADTGQVVITVNPLPVVNAGPDDTICAGTPTPLLATGASSYTWTPATGLSCTNCPNPNAGPGATTTYAVKGTDINGCIDLDTLTVNVNPLPPVTAGPDQMMCLLKDVQLQAGGATSYLWSPASGLSCTNCPDPVASPSGNTTYTVTGTDGNGCVNTDQVSVNIFPQPLIDAGPDQTICQGASVQLLGSGGVSYQWAPPTGLSSTIIPNPVANPQTNITYSLVGTDANGCTDSDIVNIIVIEPLPFVVGPGDTLCEGESAELFASGGDTYTWSPPTGLNSTTIPNPTANPTSSTYYTVVMQQSGCFEDSGHVYIVVKPQPTVDAGPDQHVFAGSSVQLVAVATNTTHYEWTPATDLSCTTCSAPISQPQKTITYMVRASNADYTCEAQDSVTLFVDCDASAVFMPNSFTPNADGHNDWFFPQGKGISVVQRFRVYSRWGEILFDARNIKVNDYRQGWDGTFKGQPMKPDVFVYILDVLCTTGEPIQIKGDISLIR